MRRGYAMLAVAIVNQAARDWIDGDDGTKDECERFFRSDWYRELRELAPDVVPEDMMGRLTDDRT